MKVDLYSHQKEAISKLKNGSILCGTVGSGKSRTAIAYFYKEICGGCLEDLSKKIHKSVDLYIITTARKRDTYEWEDELKIFSLPNSIKVTIDSWNNIKKYMEINNAFFIFDEQRVVGSGAWVKAFIKITRKNRWILLSATPGDSWADYIPVFIANGFYKNRSEFLRRHAVYSYYSKYPKIERYLEVRHLIKLRDSILIRMNYEHKIEKHKETILVDYNKIFYKTIWSKRWNIFDDEPIENISKLCYLVRKVVNSDKSRINVTVRLVEKHYKAIIFYNFDYELEILRSANYPEGTVIAEWNGKNHDPLPKGDRWVYLVQYSAGAEGWNCITTDTIIFYSQNYSYKTTVQASGRIDRLNTPYNVLYYYHLRSSAPIDIAIATCLRKKQNFNESKFVI